MRDDLPHFTCYTCNASITMTCTHGAPLPPNPKDAEIAALKASLEEMRAALELIASPKRPDGTYNRCREACEVLASEAIAAYMETMKPYYKSRQRKIVL